MSYRVDTVIDILPTMTERVLALPIELADKIFDIVTREVAASKIGAIWRGFRRRLRMPEFIRVRGFPRMLPFMTARRFRSNNALMRYQDYNEWFTFQPHLH